MRTPKTFLVNHGLTISLCLWVVSLYLPAAVPRHSTGLAIFEIGWPNILVGFLFFIAKPFTILFLVLAWLSNFVLLICIFALLAKKLVVEIQPVRIILAAFLAINLALGFFSRSLAVGSDLVLFGLLSSPAYWCWIAAFVVAFVATMLLRSHESKSKS